MIENPPQDKNPLRAPSPMSSPSDDRLETTLRALGLSLAGAFFLLPLLWMLWLSFGYTSMIGAPSVAFYNLMVPFDDGTPSFLMAMLNSLLITLLATVLAGVLGVVGAYAMAHWQPFGSRAAVLMQVSLGFAPPFLFIIPLLSYFALNAQVDSYAGLILCHQWIALPIIFWIAYSAFMTIPRAVSRTHRLYGLPDRALLRDYIIAAAMPIKIAMAVVFILVWNNFPITLILAASEYKSAPLTAVRMAEIAPGYGAIAILVAMIPPLIVALWGYRALLTGLKSYTTPPKDRPS